MERDDDFLDPDVVEGGEETLKEDASELGLEDETEQAEPGELGLTPPD
jgi:hypothetical protein